MCKSLTTIILNTLKKYQPLELAISLLYAFYSYAIAIHTENIPFCIFAFVSLLWTIFTITREIQNKNTGLKVKIYLLKILPLITILLLIILPPYLIIMSNFPKFPILICIFLLPFIFLLTHAKIFARIDQVENQLARDSEREIKTCPFCKQTIQTNSIK